MLNAAFRFRLGDPPQLVTVSSGADGLLGFSREQFLTAQVHLKDRIHPEDAGVADSLFSPHIEDCSGSFNIRLRHADGRIRCIKGQYTRQTDRASGEVLLDLLLQDARNVREPGDAALVECFKTLIEQTGDYIYIKNRNHVFLAASRSMPNLTESAKDVSELVGKTAYDILPQEIADTSYRLENQAIAEGQRMDQIEQLLAQDGTKHWVDNRKYPINGPGGEIAGIFGVAPDVTQFVEADLKLRESEATLREAQAIAGLSSYVLDLPNKRWLRSREVEELLGIGEDYTHDFEGIWPLVHPDDRPAMAQRLQGFHDGSLSSFDVEYRVLRPSDGNLRWVHVRGRLERDGQGMPLFLRGTVQDITGRKQAEASLRESKDLLQLFIENAPLSLAMFDREMRYLAVSRRWLEDYSLTGTKIIGRCHYEIFPDLPVHWKEAHRRGLAGETLKCDEDRFERADGTVHWLRWEIAPWRTGDGSVGGIVIFVEHITAHKQAEERLHLAASVFTGAREGIAITDADGTILEVNDAFTGITGYTREEVLGHNPRLLKSGLQTREFYENMWREVIGKGNWSGEVWNRAKNGNLYAEMLTINALRDTGGKTLKYVAHISDLTEIKKRERELEHIAHFDALTGLPNRTLLADRLRQAMVQVHRHKQQLAVAYIDLDGFKEINDRHGRDAGDRMLAALSEHLRDAMREGDTIARLGGDEFVAVLVDLDGEEDGAPVLARLQAAASKEVQVADRTLHVSASMGVTFYPQAEEVDADLLLRQADQAMCQAKLTGRSRLHKFDPALDLTVRGRNENIDHIRRALAAGQFVLYYQPKVNMRTGAVIGVEALIRWQHPERGLLPPGMFLPVIEDHPMAIEIGEWVIETALAQIEAWQAVGLNIPVSVNVNALQLQQPDFVDRLQALLASHPRVKASNLELEVLETSALQDLVQTSQVLLACREMGVPVALDDFGSGYASLTYLKRLPAGILKIDQSFVSGIVVDPEDLAILEGLLGLATAFRRQVIAEGVKTVDHGLMLLQMGCELAQGSAIARPIPAADLPAWVSAWRPDARWADVPPVNADSRAVLHASVEHRAWLAALEAYLEGRCADPPPLDPDQCRVGAWLKTEKQSTRGEFSAFQTVEKLHRQLHDLATAICGAHDGNRNEEGSARLRQLHCLQDEYLKQLAAFVRNGSRRTRRDRSPTRAEAAVRARVP